MTCSQKMRSNVAKVKFGLYCIHFIVFYFIVYIIAKIFLIDAYTNKIKFNTVKRVKTLLNAKSVPILFVCEIYR